MVLSTHHNSQQLNIMQVRIWWKYPLNFCNRFWAGYR